MADYVTKIRTSTGDKQIDYNALANLPNVATLDSDGKVPIDQLPSMDYVNYNEAQTLSDTQKTQARTNIGAGTSSFSGSYADLTNKPTIPSLSTSVSSTSTTTAATSSAVKQAYDLAAEATTKTTGTGNCYYNSSTSSSSSYPTSVTSQDIKWEMVNNVVYIRADINCTFQANRDYFVIAITNLPVSNTTDWAVICSINDFAIGSLIARAYNVCSRATSSYGGLGLYIEIYSNDVYDYSSDTEFSLQLSAICKKISA